MVVVPIFLSQKPDPPAPSPEPKPEPTSEPAEPVSSTVETTDEPVPEQIEPWREIEGVWHLLAGHCAGYVKYTFRGALIDSEFRAGPEFMYGPQSSEFYEVLSPYRIRVTQIGTDVVPVLDVSEDKLKLDYEGNVGSACFFERYATD